MEQILINFSGGLVVAFVLLVVAVIYAVNSVKVVPQQTAFVVERLGKFHKVLNPGLSFIIPFIDKVAYRQVLKEIPYDTPSQVCITKDNTQLSVDGIVYFQVTDPKLASYGTSNFVYAVSQLAQTSLRSVIGKMSLDETFEEREIINKQVVSAIDEAALNWGVKVLRYEIKDLTPPSEILEAMQRQITAEREKRAVILESEGKKQEQINLATGAREAAIAKSEGEKQSEINIAEGKAQATIAIANANAQAISLIAKASQDQGGETAINLKVAGQYIEAFSNLSKKNNTLIIPNNLSDISGMVGSVMKIVQGTKNNIE